MRRALKVKALATQLPLRKAPLSASAASRRQFPAWIEADDDAVAFPAKATATPRVRAGLVLRAVSTNKLSRTKGSGHVHGTR
jgi:hypothetical protein